MANSKLLKVGDKVRQTKTCCSTVEGEIYSIQASGGSLFITASDTYGACTCCSQWDLIQLNNSIMPDLKAKFADLFTKEPEKSFIKAGVMNSNKTLTTEGTEVFLNWLFKQNEAAFKKEVVDPILEAEKEKTK